MYLSELMGDPQNQELRQRMIKEGMTAEAQAAFCEGARLTGPAFRRIADAFDKIVAIWEETANLPEAERDNKRLDGLLIVAADLASLDEAISTLDDLQTRCPW